MQNPRSGMERGFFDPSPQRVGLFLCSDRFGCMQLFWDLQLSSVSLILREESD